MMRKVILLTGTITPSNNLVYTKHKNEKKREEEYIEVINFLLRELNVPIIFVENSGFEDLRINNPRFEYLTFKPRVNYDNKGKGWGEIEIIKYGLKNSKYLADCDLILKITGRYKIKNINDILQELKGKNMILSNFQYRLKTADSRVFGGSLDFFKLLVRRNLVNEKKGYYFEHQLAKTIHEKLGTTDTILENFKALPIIIGQSGTFGISYSRSPIYYWIRQKLYNILLIFKHKLNQG